MTGAMRAAMYDEARLFFESIVRENRSVVSLVDSDYTFLNGTLSALYGLDKKVTGSRWRNKLFAQWDRKDSPGAAIVLFENDYHGHKMFEHGGGWAAYRSFTMVIPEKRFAVALLANAGNMDVEAYNQPVEFVRQASGAVTNLLYRGSPLAPAKFYRLRN